MKTVDERLRLAIAYAYLTRLLIENIEHELKATNMIPLMGVNLGPALDTTVASVSKAHEALLDFHTLYEVRGI